MDQQNPRPAPESSDPAAVDEHAQGVSTPSGINRRALLRGGAAASPILLTLASGPVAATGNCVVASSFVSASVYKSRNPGTQSIACITTKAQDYCSQAVTSSWDMVNGKAPYKLAVSDLINGTLSFSVGGVASNQTIACYHVFKNSVSTAAGAGNGMRPDGDIAILQRLLALGYGASSVFTKAYNRRVWNARNDPGLMAQLVNDGGTTPWNHARLIAWLDYSANGINF